MPIFSSSSRSSLLYYSAVLHLTDTSYMTILFFIAMCNFCFHWRSPVRTILDLLLKTNDVPQRFFRTLHTRIRYFNALPFSIIGFTGHNKRKYISANTKKLIRINIIYSGILIGYVWILCIIL